MITLCFGRASAACWHQNLILKWWVSAARPLRLWKFLRRSSVDVVLVDFNFGTEHGNDFITAARQAGYAGRFLIVAGSADVAQFGHRAEAGCIRYFS